MLAAITLIIFFALVWSLIFFQIPLRFSFAIVGVLLIISSLFHLWSWGLLIPLWLIYFLLAASLLIPVIRRDFFSAKILQKFRELLPPLSVTERIALEAGDVWWEGDLFRGKPDWKKLTAMPKPQLSQREQHFLDNQVETLCGLLNDWKIVHEDYDLSKEAWDYLKDEKFFGLVIDKKYGGHGFSALAHSTIVNKIATRSLSAAITTMVPNSLGPAELIYHYGTEQQKNYFLPRLAEGKEIPCFGLTAPEAGSDAGAIPDNGIVCRGEFQGESIIGIRLNWDKRYITLAPIATVLGLAFKLYDPERLLGEKENIGITLCLVPTDHPGVEKGTRHLPAHLAFMNGPIRGKDVFIPLDWVIGGKEMCGKGWKMLMESLSIGRGISLPALGAANAKLCYRMTGAYAYVRKQFKLPIGELEGVQEALARIGGFTYICEATRIMSANAVDQQVRPSLASAITKYHLTELSRKIVNDAMDIHAGKAIQLGPKNYLGLVYEGIPTSITVEGANILTRNLIIYGQGAIRCHPFILQEIKAAQDENLQQGLINFDKLIFAHIGYTLSNISRVLAYGLTGGYLISAPKKNAFSPYYRQLTRMSAALAMISDITIGILGGQLKRKERLSARLGDVLSYLYLASAVLRYYENQAQPASDLPLVHWTVQWCLAQMQIAFNEFCENFPLRWLGKILYKIIFPWGRAYKMPADFLGQRIAEEMMRPSALRDRITQYCYLGKEQDSAHIMEQAFRTLIAAEPLQVKLKNAVRTGRVPRTGEISEQMQAALKAGILSAEEIKLMQHAQELYQLAIQVDEFDLSNFKTRCSSKRKKNLKETIDGSQ